MNVTLSDNKTKYIYNPIFGTFTLSSCGNANNNTYSKSEHEKLFIVAADGIELTYDPCSQRFMDCYKNTYTYNPKTRLFISNNLDNINTINLVDGTVVNYSNNYINFSPNVWLQRNSTIAILPNGTEIYFQQSTSTFCDASNKLLSYDPSIKNFNYSTIVLSDGSYYRYNIKTGCFTYWFNGNGSGTISALDSMPLTYDAVSTSPTYQKFISSGCRLNGFVYAYNPLKGIFLLNPINNNKSIVLLDGSVVHHNACEGIFEREKSSHKNFCMELSSPCAQISSGELIFYHEGLKIFTDSKTYAHLDYNAAQGFFS
jgi:hypothetical protein